MEEGKIAGALASACGERHPRADCSSPRVSGASQYVFQQANAGCPEVMEPDSRRVTGEPLPFGFGTCPERDALGPHFGDNAGTDGTAAFTDGEA